MHTESLAQRIARCMNVMTVLGHLQFGVGHISARDPDTGAIHIIGHLHHLERDTTTVTADDVIRIDLDGTVLEGELEPPEEYPLHTEALRARPDVGAVVHNHPEAVIAAAAADAPIVPLDVRSAMFSPAVPVLGFPTSIHINTPELGADVARALGSGHAVALQGHGALSVASTPEVAVVIAIFLERAAAMRLRMGPGAMPRTFPADQVDGYHPRGIDFDELMMTAWRYFAAGAR